MSQALQPGAVIGPWTVEQVLSWNERGGLYRAKGAHGTRILKELLFPLQLSAELRELRSQELLRAVASWQTLSHPQAISVEEAITQPLGVYLVLPELLGSTVAVSCRVRQQKPDPACVLRWADELAGLVDALLSRRHPLALEVLHSDRILLDHKSNIKVFNPGWSQMLCQDPERLLNRPVREGLAQYGKLVAMMATGEDSLRAVTETSSPDLLWMLSRCMSDLPGRSYDSFDDLRRGLRKLSVQGEEARAMRPLGATPPIAGFRIPSWQKLRRYPKLFYILSGTGMAALVTLLWLYLHWLEPERPARPGLALAISNQIFLVGEDGKARVAWQRFPARIEAMAASKEGHRLYLGLEGETSLTVLDTDSGERHTREMPGAIRLLQTTPDGLELLALLTHGRLLRLDLRENRERLLDSANGLTETSSIALVPLANATPPVDHRHHLEGFVAVCPKTGLFLFDATRGSQVKLWEHSGAETALALPSGDIVAATEDGVLHLLHCDLTEVRSQPTPAGRGRCWLYAHPDGLTFYSLHAGSGQGEVGLWRLSDLSLQGKIHLDTRPTLATVDPEGRLWIVSERGRLLRVDPLRMVVEEITRLKSQPQSMSFLAPASGPQGLDRLKDKGPLRP